MLDDGSLVIFGGSSYVRGYDPQVPENLHNDVWMFDITDRKWVQLVAESGEDGLPAKRALHQASLSGRKMIISGGTRDLESDLSVTSSIEFSCGLSDVWSFDLDSRIWTRLFQHDGECENDATLAKPEMTVLAIVAAIALVSM